MADNVPITAGSGTSIATEQMGDGSHVQRVKVTFGVTDTATDVSASNPLPTTMDAGTLLTRLENIAVALRQLLAVAASQLPDVNGRTRVTVEGIGPLVSLPTVAAVTTVSTVSTVSNVTAVASVTKLANAGVQAFALDHAVYSWSNTAAAMQRRQIAVT